MRDEELLKKAIWDVSIVTPNKIIANLKGVDFETAIKAFNNAATNYKDDEYLQESLERIKDNIGFMSIGGRGYDVSFSAQMPRLKGEEKHTCPRRAENGMQSEDSPFYGAGPMKDTWDKIGDERTCSYCGSIHPDDLIELVKKLGPKILSRSDKSYKWYIDRPSVPNAGFGAIKLYTMHLSKEQADTLNELIKAK